MCVEYRDVESTAHLNSSQFARRVRVGLLCFLATSGVYSQDQAFQLIELAPTVAELQSPQAQRLVQAQQWAATTSSEQQERIFRWGIVVQKNPHSIVDQKSGTPRRQIRLTIFPGVSFLAEHTEHHANGWWLAWKGKIIEGGLGTVEIRVVPDEENQQVAFVNVLSDVGDFNISPSDVQPYAIVVEMNPLLMEPVD